MVNKPDRLLKDEDKMAMSDIKNRWLHSSGKKTTFENDCIDEIIHTQRFIQDAKTAPIIAGEIHKDLVALQLDSPNVYEKSRRLEEYVSSMLSRILGGK